VHQQQTQHFDLDPKNNCQEIHKIRINSHINGFEKELIVISLFPFTFKIAGNVDWKAALGKLCIPN
jgi:hypothetical protein